MIFSKVKAILMEHLDVDESAVTMEASITKDLGADSLDMLDILMDLEEAYEINIPEKTTGVRVGDIVGYIQSHVTQQPVEELSSAPLKQSA